jgi:hypothetical protein
MQDVFGTLSLDLSMTRSSKISELQEDFMKYIASLLRRALAAARLRHNANPPSQRSCQSRVHCLMPSRNARHAGLDDTRLQPALQVWHEISTKRARPELRGQGPFELTLFAAYLEHLG